MNVLGNKIAAVRFNDAQDGFQSMTDNDLLKALSKFAFRTVDTHENEAVVGFSPIDDPFAEKHTFLATDTFVDGYALFLFRVDTKKIPSSAVKREYEKLIRARYPNGEKVSHAFKSEAHTSAKLNVAKNTSYTTQFTPVLYSPKDRKGYFLSSSAKVFDDFESLFGSAVLFSRQDITPLWKEGCDANMHSFLTWVWWRSESNNLKTVQGLNAEYEVITGEKIYLTDTEKGATVTSKNAVEEARVSIANGKNVSKIELNFMICSEKTDVSFLTDVWGNMTGAAFTFDRILAADDISVRNTALLLTLKNYFTLLEALKEEFMYADSTGMGLTDSVRSTWALGKFCSKAFDNI